MKRDMYLPTTWAIVPAFIINLPFWSMSSEGLWLGALLFAILVIISLILEGGAGRGFDPQ